MELKNFNTNIVEHQNGSKTAEIHAGHINYDDGGILKSIDTSLIKNSDGWKQEKASYNTQVPLYADDYAVFLDNFGGASRQIVIKPICDHVKGRIIDDEWQGRHIRYDNAFGQGTHLDYINSNVAFRKEVVIEKNPEKDLEFKFEIELPNEKIVSNNKDLSSIPSSVSGQMLIGDTNEKDNYTYIRPAKVWDSSPVPIVMPIKLYFETINGKNYLIKRISKEYLAGATYPVFTDTDVSYYSGAGDGYAYYDTTGTTWATVHAATNGTAAYYTSDVAGLASSITPSTNNFGIYRCFLPVDTSGLPDTAVISAATYYLYHYSKIDNFNDSYGYVVMVQTSQANSTQVVTEDYDQCGTVTNPTQLTTAQDITNITTGQYTGHVLNSSGLAVISKTGTTLLGIREGHDATNNALTGAGNSQLWSLANFYTSERTGTGSDPYITITYTVSTATGNFFLVL